MRPARSITSANIGTVEVKMRAETRRIHRILPKRKTSQRMMGHDASTMYHGKAVAPSIGAQTCTSRATRSGCASAKAVAIAPPIEWPTMVAARRPSASMIFPRSDT